MYFRIKLYLKSGAAEMFNGHEYARSASGAQFLQACFGNSQSCEKEIWNEDGKTSWTNFLCFYLFTKTIAGTSKKKFENLSSIWWHIVNHRLHGQPYYEYDPSASVIEKIKNATWKYNREHCTKKSDVILNCD